MSNRNDIIMSQWIYFFHWCPLPDDVTSRAEDSLSKSRGANRPYCRMTCPVGGCYDIIVPTNRTDTFYDNSNLPDDTFFSFQKSSKDRSHRPYYRMTCLVGGCYDIIVPANHTDTFFSFQKSSKYRPFTTVHVDPIVGWHVSLAVATILLYRQITRIYFTIFVSTQRHIYFFTIRF